MAVIFKAPLLPLLKPHPIIRRCIFTADSVAKFSNCFIPITTLPQNPDELLTYINSHCLSILDHIAPIKISKLKTPSSPWLNEHT